MEEGTDEHRGSVEKKTAKKPLRLLLQDYEKREDAVRKAHLDSCGTQVLSDRATSPRFTFSYAPRGASETIPRRPRAPPARGQEDAAAADVEVQSASGGSQRGSQEAVQEPTKEAVQERASLGEIPSPGPVRRSRQQQILKDVQRDKDRVMLTRFGESKRVQFPVVASTTASPFSCTYPYAEPRPPPAPPPPAVDQEPPASAPAAIGKVQKYSKRYEAKQQFYLELQAAPHVIKLRSFSAAPAFTFGSALVGNRQPGGPSRPKSRRMDLDKLRDEVKIGEMKVDWPSGF